MHSSCTQIVQYIKYRDKHRKRVFIASSIECTFKHHVVQLGRRTAEKQIKCPHVVMFYLRMIDILLMTTDTSKHFHVQQRENDFVMVHECFICRKYMKDNITNKAGKRIILKENKNDFPFPF